MRRPHRQHLPAAPPSYCQGQGEGQGRVRGEDWHQHREWLPTSTISVGTPTTNRPTSPCNWNSIKSASACCHRKSKRTSSTSGRRTGILSRIVMLTVTTTHLDDLPRMKTTATLRTRRGPSARGTRWRPHSEPPKGFTGQTTSGRNLTTRLTHG